MYGILKDNKIIARFVAPISLVSNIPCFVKDSLSLKRDIGARSAQRWELTTNLEPLTENANKLFSLLVNNGPTKPFQVVIPQNVGVIRSRNTTINDTLASGVYNSDTITVVTSGSIPEGTLVKFNNHDKLYMTTTDRSGNGTVKIFPRLRESISSAIMYWQDDVVLNMFADTDMIRGMSFSDGVLMDNGAIKFIEAL